MFIDNMRTAIIADFTKAWSLNDKAHQVEHFSNVEKTGYHINAVLDLGHDPKLITLVAYFHDMFSWSRYNHHILSDEWVMSTDYPIICSLTDSERELVGAGCREHRASRTEPFSSEFAELMSAADREWPGDIEYLVGRAVQCREARGDSPAEAMKGAIEHIREKYGMGGYAKYPDLYIRAFGDLLDKQRMDIMNL